MGKKIRKLVRFRRQLPIGNILTWPLTKELVWLILPKADDFSETAQKRRQLLLDNAAEDKRMSEPTALRNRQPWVSYLCCVVAMDRFLQCCLQAKISNPFTHFNTVSKGTWGQWGAGYRLPDSSQRRMIDRVLKERLNNPRLSVFVPPSDRELEHMGYLTRKHLSDEEIRTYCDWDLPGGDSRLKLTQRSLSWPLFRHMKVDKKWAWGEWWYELTPSVQSWDKFIEIGMKFIQRRWELYNDLHKRQRTINTVKRVVAKLGVQSDQSDQHHGA